MRIDNTKVKNNDHPLEWLTESGVSKKFAEPLYDKVLRSPEVSENANEYIYSNRSSNDLTSYAVGEEKGRASGHEEGFAKGLATGVLGTLALLGSGILCYYRNKN